MSKTEHNLINIATFHKEDSVANRAMKILRKRYNKTYHWCYEWDGLVINSSHAEASCCLCFDN